MKCGTRYHGIWRSLAIDIHHVYPISKNRTPPIFLLYFNSHCNFAILLNQELIFWPDGAPSDDSIQRHILFYIADFKLKPHATVSGNIYLFAWKLDWSPTFCRGLFALFTNLKKTLSTPRPATGDRFPCIYTYPCVATDIAKRRHLGILDHSLIEILIWSVHQLQWHRIFLFARWRNLNNTTAMFVAWKKRMPGNRR